MKVAINGLGRIGRAVLKICLEKGIKVVAVNDLTEPETLAYLIKHDSVYGGFDKKIINSEILSIEESKNPPYLVALLVKRAI